MPYYFVDGYNAIRSTDFLSRGSIQEQREQLLTFIETKRLGGSHRNEVTVVFDGHPHSSTPAWRGATRVIFSGDEDADTVIKARVDEMPHPADVIVVTNDRAIQKWIRGAKARAMSCEEFLQLGKRPASRSGHSDKPDAETAKRINAEFERLWKGKQ